MHLVPRESDKLMLHYAGYVAKQRLDRGLRLNYPEAIAYISMQLLELAREGKTVAELMQMGKQMLSKEQVLSGVAEMIHEIQLEATFIDGTKLVTVHDPIQTQNEMVPGEFYLEEGDITLNAGKESFSISVTNTADRPIQVGSHFHFFEANKKLMFDRKMAYGKRMDIPAGTAVRFEPGETKTVYLIDIGGARKIHGLNGLTEGYLDDPKVRETAFRLAKEKGFLGA